MTKPRRTSFTILLALAVAMLAMPAAAFTLEQVMSAPMPSDMSAAPSGGGVAWVQNDRGVRNIWLAMPPDYRGRQLTSYTEDDGQELGTLEWAPDGKTIVFVRGGGTNSRGEVPNPTHDIEGAEQEVWRVTLDGTTTKVGDGHSPAVSPRGDLIAFIAKSQIWSAPLDGSADAKQMIKARGGAGSLRWSPDSSTLAFTSRRGDHGFIGVYEIGATAVRYLSPSVDRDVQPVWSPDGKKIAFIRIPAMDDRAFLPDRTAEPWSILVADPASGTAKTIWRADEGTGSAYRGVTAANDLLWTADDRIVFPWEKEGWVHLYAIPAKGGTPALLTPGAFEVEQVELSPDRKSIVYNSNQGDIDRRHLWRVSPAGGKPVAITTGNGIEWSPRLASDGETLFFLRSDGKHPAHAAIRTASGTFRDLAPQSMPADFPAADLVEPQQVIFDAADGMKIHGQLFVPKSGKKAERHPALIFFHGGSRRQMLLGWHYSGYYSRSYAMNQYMASKGYVVLAVNYRSGIGYGMEFREAIEYGAAGASEFNDVLGAGLYLRNRDDVDGKRIGLWGGSYGGYLTALGLARASDLFAAGVDLHGVHDWNVVIRNFVPSYDPLERQAAARLAFESSPMADVSTWRSPVLMIHGDDDRNVPFSETVTMIEALRKQKVDVEQLIFPDEVHSFLRWAHWMEAYTAAADFFDRKLGGK